MNRYIIESPHEAEECERILRDVLAMGYIHHFEWGCKAGDHTGWAIVEVENINQARAIVPPLVRPRARIVPLTRWFAEDFEDK
ncbi:MAG TPA: hypothetical protein PLD25_04010 [Chloroflexota bacterium]|nr:hypothetical protein [Chloroflexota bacterium]